MLDEDQVGRFEGHGHVGLDAGELPLDPAGRHELPDPEVAQIELIEEPVLVELSADVDTVVHPVRPELLEEVGEHGLGPLLLRVQRHRDGVVQSRHALLEFLAAAIDEVQVRVERPAIGGHTLRHITPVGLELSK